MAISRFETPAPYVKDYIPEVPLFDLNAAAPIFAGMQQEWNAYTLLPDQPIPSTPGDLGEVVKWRNKVKEAVDKTAEAYQEDFRAGRKMITQSSREIAKELQNPNSDIYKVMSQAQNVAAFKEEASKNEHTNPYDINILLADINQQANRSSFIEDDKGNRYFRPISTPFLLNKDIDPPKIVADWVKNYITAVTERLNETEGPTTFRTINNPDGTLRYEFLQEGKVLDPAKIFNAAQNLIVEMNSDIQQYLQFEEQIGNSEQRLTGKESNRGYNKARQTLVTEVAKAMGYTSYNYTALKQSTSNDGGATNTPMSVLDPFSTTVTSTNVEGLFYGDTRLAGLNEEDLFKTTIDNANNFKNSNSEYYVFNVGKIDPNNKNNRTYQTSLGNDVYIKNTSTLGQRLGLPMDLRNNSNLQLSFLETLSEKDPNVMNNIRRVIKEDNPNLSSLEVNEIAGTMFRNINDNIINHNNIKNVQISILNNELELANADGNVAEARRLRAILSSEAPTKEVTASNFQKEGFYGKLLLSFQEEIDRLKYSENSYGGYKGRGTRVLSPEDADKLNRLQTSLKHLKDPNSALGYAIYMEEVYSIDDKNYTSLIPLTNKTYLNIKKGEYYEEAVEAYKDKNLTNREIFRFLSEGVDYGSAESRNKLNPLQSLEWDTKAKFATPPAKGNGYSTPIPGLAQYEIIPIKESSEFKDKARSGTPLTSDDLKSVYGIIFEGWTYHNGQFKATGYLQDSKGVTTEELVVFKPYTDTHERFLNQMRIQDPSYIATMIKTMTESSAKEYGSNNTLKWDATGILFDNTKVVINKDPNSNNWLVDVAGTVNRYSNLFEASVAINKLMTMSGPTPIIGKFAGDILKNPEQVNANISSVKTALQDVIKVDQYNSYYSNFKNLEEIRDAFYKLIKIETAGTFDTKVQSMKDASTPNSTAIGLFQNIAESIPSNVTSDQYASWSPEAQIAYNVDRIGRYSRSLGVQLKDFYDLYLFNFYPNLLTQSKYKTNRENYTVQDLKDLMTPLEFSRNPMFSSAPLDTPILDILKKKL